MGSYSESELILNADGTVFHLKLHPGQISDTVILVGDPARVAWVGQFLENTETLASNREFISLSGYHRNHKVTVLSTGIGPDNIDIVVNELDALANIDFTTRSEKPDKKALNLIRIGTSGSLQPDIKVGTAVAAAWSIGLDGVMNYYARKPDPERNLFDQALISTVGWPENLPLPYSAQASSKLLKLVEPFCLPGITIAAHGFYGPQGRQIRAKLAHPGLNSRLQAFRYGNLRTTNFEMESSALQGLAQELNHEALTVCLIIANRMTGEFLGEYSGHIKKLISETLDSIIK